MVLTASKTVHMCLDCVLQLGMWHKSYTTNVIINLRHSPEASVASRCNEKLCSRYQFLHMEMTMADSAVAFSAVAAHRLNSLTSG